MVLSGLSAESGAEVFLSSLRQVERCCSRALPLIAPNPQGDPGTPSSGVITILYLWQVPPSHGITEGKPDCTKSSPTQWQSENHKSKGEKTTKIATHMTNSITEIH